MSEPLTYRIRRDDHGFTLVEVMVTVVMISLIAAVLAAAITVMFRSEDSAVRVSAESHDTQQGVNYFVLDVQSGPSSPSAYDTSAVAPGCTSGGGNVLQITDGTRRVSYRLDVGSGRLDRYACENTGTAASPVWSNVNRVNIADSLDTSVVPSAFVTLEPNGSTLKSATLTLAQQGGGASVVASPRAEPPDSPVECATANPIAASNGFGVFVEGDVQLDDGVDSGRQALTGGLALGGRLSWSKNIKITGGLYASAVDWTGGTDTLNVANGDARIGGVFSESDGIVTGDGDKRIDVTSQGVFPASGRNFAADFDALRNCSAQLARLIDLCEPFGCASEVGLNPSGSTLELCPGGQGAQVVNLPERYLTASYKFSVRAGCSGFSTTSPIIINVTDDNRDLTVDFSSHTEWNDLFVFDKNVIFNFPDARFVNITRHVHGQVLAPFAHVTTDMTDAFGLDGGIVARQWTHASGIVYATSSFRFAGTIAWP